MQGEKSWKQHKHEQRLEEERRFRVNKAKKDKARQTFVNTPDRSSER